MGDFRLKFDKLCRQRLKRDLIPSVDGELGDSYDCENLTNLKVDFMRACFNRIAPNLRSQDYVKEWMNYTDAWKSKSQRSEATALRMLLTAQIGYPVYKRFPGLNDDVVAGILLAIQESDRGTPRDEGHVTITIPARFNPPFKDPPQRTRIPENQFSPLIEFSADIKPNCRSLLAQQDMDPDDHCVVYVLDVTPSLKEGDQDVFWSLRRNAHLREEALQLPKGYEKAGQALNKGQLIYYVGYTQNFPHRMWQHNEGIADGSAWFTNLFRPKSVLEVNEYPTKERAKQRERSRAREINKEDAIYVYQK